MWFTSGFQILMVLAAPVIFVLLIVALIGISRHNREIKELRRRQEWLEALCDQSFAVSGSPAAPFQPVPPTQPVLPTQPVPRQVSSFQPSTQPSTQLPFQPARSFQPVSQSALQPAPQFANTSQPTSQPFAQPTSQPAPQPIQPAFQPAPQPTFQPTRSSQLSLEALFGRNIIGIVASILVFLGLVFLGFLVVPLLTNALKIAALFLLSTLLVAAGFILDHRYNNNFTKALLGTGCGAFFISIMLTHLWFHAISDLVALAILLIWLILCFVLTRRTQSLLVAIITHVGMVISVSAACWVSVDEGKMMLVLIYQVAATVVILVGNILCYRKTYRFGLYMSLVVSLFASAIFWIHILPRITAFSAAIPSVLDAIYFFTQFIGATALAYLLFVSTTRVKNSGSQVVLQSFTVLLWLSALTLNVGAFIVWAMKNGTGLSFAQISGLMTLVLVVLATIFALLTILLRQTLSFSRAMERATVCLVAGYSCFFCLCRLLSCWLFVSPLGVFSGLLYFIVPAAVLVLIRKLTDDELYGYLAIIPLGIDALFMAVIGYAGLEKLAPLGPSLIYLALMGALFWFVYWTLPDERRFRHGTAFKFAMLLYFEVSLCCAALWTDYDPAFALTLLLCVIALAVFHFRGGDRPLWAYRINEYGVVLVAAAITFRPVDDAVLFVVRLILVLACLALMLERVRQAATHSAVALREGRPVPRSDVETFTALALFLLIVAAVNSLADWSELPYVLSLACMVVALLVVALGFWSRVRSLRLTGLVVLVICVLKLTVVDIGEVNSLMRVVSFISGGVICFAISALYNFLVKLQGKNT